MLFTCLPCICYINLRTCFDVCNNIGTVPRMYIYIYIYIEYCKWHYLEDLETVFLSMVQNQRSCLTEEQHWLPWQRSGNTMGSGQSLFHLACTIICNCDLYVCCACVCVQACE